MVIELHQSYIQVKAKCLFCGFPGSHGCHLFSTEPEDKSAGVGARGSVQSSPETQHEETHLNRHVDTHRSPSSFDLTLSRSLIRKHRCARTHRPKYWPVRPTVSLFNLFIWHDRHMHAYTYMHTHTGRGCIVKKSAEEEEGKLTYLLLLGRQTCIYFHSFHMHLPSSPFILSSSCGEETHQLMFSFTVIGWFEAASVNCAPPHCSSSPLCHPPPPQFSVLPSFAFALLTSFLQSEVIVYVIDVSLTCAHNKLIDAKHNRGTQAQM